ncbi:Rdx family protein [Streptomyces xiaopingdaonensis]|uniref:Rdx family protein n=1 Tax=Streptomyces xiaopingdaonensis TaxID=1565415 RepID=UPI000362BA4B|nr:Rdx family protein [Streptomyces xiaopingdaonensis]
MYLVHLAISAPGDACPPAEIRQALESVASDVLEHVSVHPRTRRHLVIGIFLRVASLDEAEATAKLIWERAATAFPELAEWRLRRAEVPLLPFELE